MPAKEAQSPVPPAPANPPQAQAAAGQAPLCVDLDGTLIRTDSSWEAVAQLLFRRPLRLVGILLGGVRGRAWMKKELARAAASSDGSSALQSGRS